jgi:hypothetical protein
MYQQGPLVQCTNRTRANPVPWFWWARGPNLARPHRAVAGRVQRCRLRWRRSLAQPTGVAPKSRRAASDTGGETAPTSLRGQRAALSKRSELTKLLGNTTEGIGFAASQAIVTLTRIFQACSRTKLNTYSPSRGRSQNGPARAVRSGGAFGVGRWFVSFQNLCGRFSAFPTQLQTPELQAPLSCYV